MGPWRLVLLLGGFGLMGLMAQAQAFHAANPGAGTAALTGDWQFRIGDDLRWRLAGMDDGGWERVKAEAPWGAQGHAGYSGFAWYRRRVDVDGAGPAMGVLFPPVDDAYEVFWNGELVGRYGGMPPRARWFEFGHTAVYGLPGTGSAGAHGELAVRVWKAPFYLLDDPQTGGFEEAPTIGDRGVLEAMREATEAPFATSVLPRAAFALVLVVAGLMAFALWWTDRERLFLWLAGYLLCSGLYGLMWLPPIRFGWYAQPDQLGTLMLGSISEPFLWALFLSIFGLSGNRGWRRLCWWMTAAFLGAVVADSVVVLLWAHAGSGLRRTDDVLTWMMTVCALFPLVLVGAGLRSRRAVTLWPLVAAVVAAETYAFLVVVSQQLISMGSTLFAALTRPHLTIGPYRFSMHTLMDIVLGSVLVGTVLRVQARQRRRQGVLEGEMQSAREVQQVLLPEEVAAIPGYSVTTVYQPAAEVGGDFFQVMPTAEGSLVVLGDVSGKGLAAAMMVSLIVGTLRTLAETESGPAAVLAGLNRRLLGRTRGGFTTCVAMLVGEDGMLRVASAGHPAPYWNGREMPMSIALPLGVVREFEVEERAEWMAVGDWITLYTDGLPEARNEKGELYGFDRVKELLADGPRAEEIVAVARNFGQEDDLTVLTLVRTGFAEGSVSAMVEEVAAARLDVA